MWLGLGTSQALGHPEIQSHWQTFVQVPCVIAQLPFVWDTLMVVVDVMAHKWPHPGHISKSPMPWLNALL